MSQLMNSILHPWLPEWELPQWLLILIVWLRGTALFKFFNLLYFYIFIVPFARLYLQGPWFSGFGFWNGLPPHEICSRLNGASGPLSGHFSDHPEVCLEMIERDISAKLILVETVVFLPLVLYCAIKLSILLLSGKCCRQA